MNTTTYKGIRVRALAALSTVAVLASLAFVAGPLATATQAAAVNSLEDFYDEIEAAANSVSDYTISLESNIVFTPSDAPAELYNTAGVYIEGNGYTISCSVPNECEGWLVVSPGDASAFLSIRDLEVSHFQWALAAYDTRLAIADSVFHGNGIETDAASDFRGAGVSVLNTTGSSQYTTLEHVDFIDNKIVVGSGCAEGAGLYAEGDVFIDGGTFEGNRVALTDEDAADYHCRARGAAAVISDGIFDMTGTAFLANSTEGVLDLNVDLQLNPEDRRANVGGGALSILNSEGGIWSGTFTGNHTDGLGGAISLENAWVQFGVVEYYGGIQSAGFALGQTPAQGYAKYNLLKGNTALGGGGLYAWNSVVSGDRLEVDSNTSQGDGGGLYAVDSALYVVDSTFKHNAAGVSGSPYLGTGAGGGIALERGYLYGGDVWTSEIDTSTIHGNTARYGGGLAIADNFLEMDEVTIAENAGFGAGVFASYASVDLEHVTVARNVAEGEGAAQLYASFDAGFRLSKTVISDAVGGGANCGRNTDGGLINSWGYNAADDDSCELLDGDLQLEPGEADFGPLQFNGGLTWTMLPYPGSPLIDAIEVGVEGGCEGESSDQRGVTRPQGQDGGDSLCDIGAAETFPMQSFPVATAGGTVWVHILNSTFRGEQEDYDVFGIATGDLNPAPPAGVNLPYGAFNLTVPVWDESWPVDVYIETAAPTNQLWKLWDGQWQAYPGSQGNGGKYWAFRLIDGADGDTDGVADRVIHDPVAVGIAAAFTG